MSLKALHIVFIIASVLMSVGFAGWCGYYFFNYGEIPMLIMGVLSLLTGVVLVVYGKRFLQKLKHVNYL